MPTVTFRTTTCNDCNREFVSTIYHPRLSPSSLRSRAIPTHPELAQTMSFLRDEEHEVERYEQELACLRKTIQKLESEATLLKQCIQERRQWVTAVRRVPSEIWRHIFDMACDTAFFTSSSEQSARYQTTPAFDFSRVSSYWRSIVNAFPRLWSSLRVDVYQLTGGLRCLIQLYLRNAGACPLRVKILAKPGFDSEKSSLKSYLGRDGRSTLRMLLKALSRCSEVSFDIDDAILSAAPHRIEGEISFSQLQALTLVRCTSWNVFASGSISPLWEHLSRATQLRRISLDSGLLMDAGVLLYHQLTSVEIDLVDIGDILLLLESCPHLLSLHWNTLLNSTIPSADTPVVAPRLRELSILGVPLPKLDTFFSYITLPSLTIIELCPFYRSMYDPEVYGNERWSGEELLANMLERSNAPMEKLFLDCQDWHLTLGGLDAILQACSGLTSLEIFLSQPTPNGFILGFLSRFSAPRDHNTPRPPIVPRLTQLRLHEVLQSDTEASPQTLESIIQMAEYRAQAMALKYINVSFSTEIICRDVDKTCHPVELEPDVRDRARKLQKDGMQLSISWINRGPVPSLELWPGDDSESDSDSATESDSSDMEG